MIIFHVGIFYAFNLTSITIDVNKPYKTVNLKHYTVNL